ncbi:MAG TPA: hypothetical protein VEI97_04345, partial [bacterium]|nr:hypothetical protein [bacterium]
MPPASDSKLLRGHKGYVSTVVFSPDGKWLASSSSTAQDRTTRLWSVATRREVDSYPSNHSPVFSPDSKYLVTSATIQADKNTQQIVVVAREVGKEKPVFKMAGGDPAFTPDGRWLAIGNRNPATNTDVVQLFQLPSGQAGPVIEGRMPAFSADGALIATCSRVDGKWRTQVWDAATGRQAAALSDAAHVPG